MQILLDALIQIIVPGFCFFFYAHGNHGNLVRDNFCASQGLCQSFGLCFLGVTGNLSAKGHDALVTILTDFDIFEAGLIECLSDAVGKIR